MFWLSSGEPRFCLGSMNPLDLTELMCRGSCSGLSDQMDRGSIVGSVPPRLNVDRVNLGLVGGQCFSGLMTASDQMVDRCLVCLALA
jgi:hypothetical protein